MKSLRLYLIILSGIIVIYLIAQFNRPKAIDWAETFDSTSKAPFGTYIIYNRVNDIFPHSKVETFREPPYNVITDHNIKHSTYLIINSSINPNEYDCAKLAAFIKSGNDVFIAASNLGGEFAKKFKTETNVELQSLTKLTKLKFTNKYLDSNKTYVIGKNTANNFFSSFDTAKAVVLGANNFKHANFIKYTLGKGNLYINANPLIFSNYSLLDDNGSKYVSIALSYVKTGHPIIWDQYYALGREYDGSSMQVFLEHKALRWAFYLTFFSLILFVLYEVKRRQRIIPVVEPLENATLSFVNVVGQVYFEQHDNKNIANKKILYFLEHLRVEHNLKTNILDGEFAANLSQKTGIDKEFANDLINYFNYVNQQPSITNAELIALNKLIEQFYTKST